LGAAAIFTTLYQFWIYKENEKIEIVEPNAQELLTKANILQTEEAYDEVCIQHRNSDECTTANQNWLALLRTDNDISKIQDEGIKCELLTAFPDSQIHNVAPASSDLILPNYLTDIDLNSAKSSCVAARLKYKNIPEFSFYLGRIYEAEARKTGNPSAYKDASNYYLEAVLKDYGPAFSSLGYLYGGGKIGLTEKNEANLETAYRIFEGGKNKGLVEPTLAFAYYTQFGFGTSEGEAKPQIAKDIFQSLSDVGSAEAARRLGHLHRYGYLGKVDYTEAAINYDLAYSRGINNAFLDIIDMKFDGKSHDSRNDIEVEAFNELKDFVDKNPANRRALNMIGWAYHHGKGVKQNNFEAIQNYNDAKNLGYAYAAINLGDAIANNELGFDGNKNDAFEEFNVAISLGEADGLLKKAQTLLDGAFSNEISDKDKKQAYVWIEKAKNKSNGNWATNYYAYVKMHGFGTDANYPEAYDLFTYLVDVKKYPTAIENIVYMHENCLVPHAPRLDLRKYLEIGKNLKDHYSIDYLQNLGDKTYPNVSC
jgi:TPR repeat protein